MPVYHVLLAPTIAIPLADGFLDRHRHRALRDDIADVIPPSIDADTGVSLTTRIGDWLTPVRIVRSAMLTARASPP